VTPHQAVVEASGLPCEIPVVPIEVAGWLDDPMTVPLRFVPEERKQSPRRAFVHTIASHATTSKYFVASRALRVMELGGLVWGDTGRSGNSPMHK
jgi:hypothetical protein